MKKLLILKIIVIAIVVICGSHLFAAGNARDLDFDGFEKGKSPLWRVIGIPAGIPQDAGIEITDDKAESHNGNHGLAFHYTRGTKPVPVLFHFVLLRDFKSIRFWIKPKIETVWVVSVKDTDGAVFSARTSLREGKWKHIVLKPSDFTCNPDSPVHKAGLDPDKLTFGYAGFDLFTLTQDHGKNEIYLDEVKVTRSPYKLIKGDYVLNRTEKTIEHPTKIEGNIFLVNGAKLTVNSSRFEVTGSIRVVKGSKLVLNGGIWSFPQDFRYQNHIAATRGGRIEFKNGFLHMNHNISGIALDKASFDFINVSCSLHGFTFSLGEGCSLRMEQSKKMGEFILNEDTTFSSRECSDILLWLRCGKGITADLKLLSGSHIDTWKSMPALKRTIYIDNCDNMLWALIADPGCDVTFRESELRAVGIYYDGTSHSKISGLKNKTTYDDFKLLTEQHKIRLINTLVTAWNLYTNENAELEIRDCVYGESISFGESKIYVYDSVCDSTGGFFGANNDSVVNFYDGEIIGDILSRKNSRIIIRNSSVPADIKAVENSQIILINCDATGTIQELGNGKVRRQQ